MKVDNARHETSEKPISKDTDDTREVPVSVKKSIKTKTELKEELAHKPKITEKLEQEVMQLWLKKKQEAMTREKKNQEDMELKNSKEGPSDQKKESKDKKKDQNM